MKISIIIPVKPGGEVGAIAALRLFPSDPVDYEVIVAEGTKPSRQRNMAAAEARGEILYFLDDDSIAVPDALERISSYMQDDRVAVVGGPSLTPADNSPLQRAVAWALSSVFGGGGVRNRYRQHGVLRETDDSELILCNLAFRRSVFISAGGLDERLYPNEENELIDRLLAAGHRLLHDPDLFVVRSQRPDIRAFIRQMLTYGKGRAEQTLLSRSIDLKAVIPAMFVIYVLLIPTVRYWWYLIPAELYLAIVAVNMILALRRESIALVWRLPLVYTLLHFCYGAGFITGLFSPRYRRRADVPVEVTLRRLKSLGRDW